MQTPSPLPPTPAASTPKPPLARSEEVEVRLSVRASFSLTLGLYSGPIDKKCIAENLSEQIASILQAGSLEEYIDGWGVEEVVHSATGTALVSSEQSSG